MEAAILKSALTQGIWALLFVFMLWYVLKTNDERESKYQQIIENLTSQFGIVEEVQKDVREIKDRIFK